MHLPPQLSVSCDIADYYIGVFKPDGIGSDRLPTNRPLSFNSLPPQYHHHATNFYEIATPYEIFGYDNLFGKTPKMSDYDKAQLIFGSHFSAPDL